ncbi:MAG: hypothetical protein ACK40U_07805, partial [Fervidobacterium pennivorans]
MAKIGNIFKSLSTNLFKILSRKKLKAQDTPNDLEASGKPGMKNKLAQVIDKVVNLIKSLWARKLLFGIVVGSLVLGTVGIIFLTRPKEKETVVYEGTGNVENLSISIPQGAFPYDKYFKIRIPRQSTLQSVLSTGKFVSPI